VVIDTDGRAAGQITSFAYTKPDFTFFALACVERDFPAEPGDTIQAVREPIDKYRAPGKPNARVDLEILTRFPEDEERAAWPGFYV